MGHEHAQELDLEIIFPVFFLVRVPEVKDAEELVRHTLRLGGRGQENARQWFVPVFTSEQVAQSLADELKKIDDKLRVIGVGSHRDWQTLLEAFQANGDKYTAFDPQPNYVEHIAIQSLLCGTRRPPGERDPDSAGRAGDPGTSRSWLRRRPAAARADAPESGNDRVGPDTPRRTGGGSRFG
jgi:hypothetical protein